MEKDYALIYFIYKVRIAPSSCSARADPEGTIAYVLKREFKAFYEIEKTLLGLIGADPVSPIKGAWLYAAFPPTFMHSS